MEQTDMTGFSGRTIVVTGTSGGIVSAFFGAGFVAVGLEEPTFVELDRLGDGCPLSRFDLPGIPPVLATHLIPRRS